MCLTNLPHNWNSLWSFFSRCILAHKSQNCSILPEQLALNWTLTVVDRCWSRYHFRETSHLLSIKLQNSPCVIKWRPVPVPVPILLYPLHRTHHSHKVKIFISNTWRNTLGARCFSCAVSGFESKWPARKASGPERDPFDSAKPITTPLIYPNIQNLDVLLVGSLEMSNASNALNR